MTIEFKKWQKIQQFHNIRKSISKIVDYKRTVGEDIEHPGLNYRGKVKLDGTNAGIRVVSGEVVAQSRSRLITPEDDNYGFAAYVDSIKEMLVAVIGNTTKLTIFGEWCGNGIQKRCSVSKCKKMFVVFAIEFDDESSRLVEPVALETLFSKMKGVDIHVLPWYGEEITVDYGSQASIDSAVNKMCEAVADVEKCDPWVKENFGHEGLGEGIVYYPSVWLPRGFEDVDFMFKAKGEEHKNVIQLKPVISDPEMVANVDAFVAKFVTENRLAQGLTELGLSDPSTKDTGAFLKWFGNDVKSESADELEVSGLAWKDVSKRVSVAARTWFFERV